MSLARRHEVSLYAQMNFERTSFEPAPSTSGEVGGLVDSGDPERFLIERSGLILTPDRHRKLDMIQEKDLHECSHFL
jgi:hypothetical protein